MEIPLSKVYAVPNPQQYKLHLASWNGADQPLYRWASYVGTGHGHTDELTQIIDKCASITLAEIFASRF